MSTTLTFPWGSPVFSGGSYYTAGMGNTQGVTAIAGTAAVTNGSANVTGTGTNFTTDLAVGQYIQFGSDTTYTRYQIQSIGGGTALVLGVPGGSTTNYTGTTYASTTVVQSVAAAICPLQYYFDIGVQVTADSCSLGYFVKSGTSSPVINYSYDGSTFASVGTLTADSRFHTIALPSWPGGTVNLWLRGGTLTDNIVYNGDQLLTATTAAGSPSIAAVAALGISPPGTLTSLGVPQWEGKIQIEGNSAPNLWSSDKVTHVAISGDDARVRFKAQCSEIWVKMYGGGTSSWIGWMVDDIWQGATLYNDNPPNRAAVVQRADSLFYWYKVAGGLDNGMTHEYSLYYGAGGARITAVAVNGSFTGTTVRSAGTALAFGDSIWGGINNDGATLHWYVSEYRNWNIANYGVFGAFVQQSIYQDGRFPAISIQATGALNSSQCYRDKPGLILVNGGFNDAAGDSAAQPAYFMRNQTNFSNTLTTMLQSIRLSAPQATVLMFNILPSSNLADGIRGTYNGLISTVVTSLADPKVKLVDISSISGYNTGGSAKAHLTNAPIGGVLQAGFTIDAAGSNYGNAQTVTVSFVGGGGTGAAGYATSSAGGLITSLTLTSGGSGYTQTPNLVVGDTTDGTHPNFNGYQKMWNQAAASIPAYSVGSGGVRFSNFGGGFRG